MNQLFLCLLVGLHFIVANDAFTASGPAAPKCSILGVWNATVISGQHFEFHQNGKVTGTLSSNNIVGQYCKFTGSYSVSPIDGFFRWDMNLDRKCVYGDAATADQMIDQTMCYFPAPQYESSSYDLKFTSGCFVAFSEDCKVLQFTDFNGVNAGVGHFEQYVLTSAPAKANPKYKGDTAPQCSVVGEKVSTITRYGFHVNFNKLYEYTYFNISYKKDGTYTSTITYAPPSNSGSAGCHVAWTGNYYYSKAQLENFPNVTLHPYHTSGSLQTVPPVIGTYCTNYLFDPASCEYLTTSSSSYQSDQCFIAWDNFVRAPECKYFRLYNFNGFSGPALQVLKKHNGKHDDDVVSSLDISDSASLHLSFLSLLVVVILYL